MTLPQIGGLISTYKYLIIFPIAVIEGPVISMVTGFFVYLHLLNGWFAYSLLVLADVVGDALYYALGRWGGRWLLKKAGRLIGITPKKIIPFEKKFLQHDWKILLFGKTQAVGGVILAAAGAVKMPILNFLKWNTLGTIPKVLILFSIGYFFGHGYESITKYADYTAVFSIIAGIVLAIAYFKLSKYFQTKL